MRVAAFSKQLLHKNLIDVPFLKVVGDDFINIYIKPLDGNTES
jgi:hypothetical protein